MLRESDFNSIRTLVERLVHELVGSRRSFFVTDVVVKVDKLHKCVYLKEFGDQPVPLVGFGYDVSYYDNNGTSTSKRQAKVEITMPKIGEHVLVARELGLDRIPRCLGVILGTNWIAQESD